MLINVLRVERDDNEQKQLIETVEDVIFPNEKDRPEFLCRVCGRDSYPKCQERCPAYISDKERTEQYMKKKQPTDQKND